MPFRFGTKRSLGAGLVGGAASRVQDVFSTTPYTGGSNKAVTTGVDLTQGGTAWFKNRTNASGTFDHFLVSSARTFDKWTSSNTTAAEQSGLGATVNSTGFVISSAPDPWVVWSFKKAAKFYTEVVYTGDGVSIRQIAHDLGIEPGMIAVKQLNSPRNWAVYHRSLPTNGFLLLNTTDAQGSTSAVFPSSATLSSFTVGSASEVNASGATYLARIWAHDPSADGIIQCGSYTTIGDGSGPTITLGWRPQFLLMKCSSASGDWYMFDAARGFTSPSTSILRANTSAAENVSGANIISASATGFKDNGLENPNSTYTYLAIRAPT